MSMSASRIKNMFFQISFVFFSSIALLAGEPSEGMLFSISNEHGARVEIVLEKEGGAVARFFEDDDFLLMELPLEGGLEIGGLTVSEFRVWMLSRNLPEEFSELSTTGLPGMRIPGEMSAPTDGREQKKITQGSGSTSSPPNGNDPNNGG